MLVAAICVIALAALVHRMSNREHAAWDPSFLSASQNQKQPASQLRQVLNGSQKLR
jgi:hypothetical protein